MTDTTGTTRRNLITTGALGAAAAAFLAVCGTKDSHSAGASGLDPTPTAVPPTAPVKEPSASDKTYDVTVLRTAASLELLAAAQYAEYGPKLSDATWAAEAARMGEDHTAAAAIFNGEIVASAQVDEPNSYTQENTIDPIAGALTSDTAILDLFAGLESTLTATYLTAVGTMTTEARRALFASHAGAAARRNAVLGNGGTGNIPAGPLYPTADLIANDAYLPVDAPAADGEG